MTKCLCDNSRAATQILRDIRVLILVDQHVSETSFDTAGVNVGMLAEQPDVFQQKIGTRKRR